MPTLSKLGCLGFMIKVLPHFHLNEEICATIAASFIRKRHAQSPNLDLPSPWLAYKFWLNSLTISTEQSGNMYSKIRNLSGKSARLPPMGCSNTAIAMESYTRINGILEWWSHPASGFWSSNLARLLCTIRYNFMVIDIGQSAFL